MDANSGGVDTDTAGMMMLRTTDGAWYELKRVDAEQAAAVERAAAVAGTDEVVGFGGSWSGTLWWVGRGHGEWGVFKVEPNSNGVLTGTHTVGFAPRPSSGFPGVATGG